MDLRPYVCVVFIFIFELRFDQLLIEEHVLPHSAVYRVVPVTSARRRRFYSRRMSVNTLPWPLRVVSDSQ